MPVRRMKRLLPLLDISHLGDDSSRVADVTFNVEFAHDEQGLVRIRIDVDASLPLMCQRSLMPYDERVTRSSELTVVTTAEEADQVPDHYEPVLVEQGRIALNDLVEDELLLGLPAVPRNPDVQVIQISTDGKFELPSENEERTRKPFAGLAGLMKENASD